jgi:hypothetical protein
MKRCSFFLLVLLLLSAQSGWCGRKVTVAQLQDLLHSLHEEKKSDVEIAAALQQVELSEQLTRVVMNGISKYSHGPLTTEQIYVLQARSANLLPPASDLPQTPAPDAPAQQAILTRAQNYINKTYEQLPALAARKTILRFQDNTEALASSSGIASGAKDAVTSSGMSNPGNFLHYINAVAHPIVLEHGLIKKLSAKDSTRWGANGQIDISQPDPGLPRVFKEAQASGTLHWVRWESINGKPAAVFSYEIPRQKSDLEVKVCCFPDIKQAGVARFYTPSTGPVLGAEKASGGGGVAGNFQTNTYWHDFKASVPYHGSLFIDPETGIVLRMIVETDLKPSDVVHQLDTRIDYGPVKAGQGTFIVPVKSVIISVVVPNGESGAGGYSTRTTLFSSEYSEYRPAHSNQ